MEGAVKGSSPGSGAFKITETELVERMMDSRSETGSARAAEVENWIRRIVKERCRTDKEGYLGWK